MRQIGVVNPELLEIFPCYMESKNSVDKNLMNLVIHCAVKGIGPVAMVEILHHGMNWSGKKGDPMGKLCY